MGIGTIDFGTIDFGTIGLRTIGFGTIDFGTIDFGTIDFGTIDYGFACVFLYLINDDSIFKIIVISSSNVSDLFFVINHCLCAINKCV